MMHDYKKLVVWQRATELAVKVYELTEHFPPEERFGLTSQMRRSVVSIASNIAEGRLRGGEKEFYRFLSIAFASAGELETQIEIAKRLNCMKELVFDEVINYINEVMKMLNVLMRKLKA